MKFVFRNYNSATSGNDGFTLIELVVVMGIFIVVIMISAGAFEKITSHSAQQIKSADSNIQGIIGLEIMRSDLEHAGYGLPYVLDFVPAYDDSEVADNYLAKGINPADFNDKNITAAVDANKVPKAVQSAKASGSAAASYELDRDYLVIKSTFAGMNSVAKKWSYIEGTGATSTIKLWGSADDFVENDEVIVLNARTKALIGTSAKFSFTIPNVASSYAIDAVFQPPSVTDNYLIYGIRTVTSTSTVLKFPYNRVDYYVKRPSTDSNISTRCAPNTGLLYKAVYTGGGVTSYPLLDCIADMQVIYSLDTNEDGGVDLHGNEDVLSLLSAEQIRKQLKEIRVYVLAHDGQKDNNFNYPTSLVTVGEFGLGRVYDLTTLFPTSSTEWKKFRWKVYSLVVVPKNI